MKKNKKEMIFDYVYDELDLKERKEVEELIDNDSEYRKFYFELKDGSDLLSLNDYEEVDADILENQRKTLLYKLFKNKQSLSISSFISELATKLVFYLGNPIKYAAIIIITIVLTNKMNNSNNSENKSYTTPKADISLAKSSGNEGLLNFSSPELIRVSDFNYETDGENITLEVDISAKQKISGKIDDPKIVLAMNQLAKNGDNPGVKLRSMKVMNDLEEDGFKTSLINLMLNDPTIAVRRKAMSILTKNGLDNETKEALIKLINSKSDAILKIEALTALEKAGESGAGNALELLAEDDPELIKLNKKRNVK
ncbi:MAG: hypothetical protein CR982_02010 [Candidatus Cloacimonadota bacterium]|nr:MAG: hypothetical protein CR982_02010 [Candidatus Cloacimonadota bacterium]PIE78941.1 MAG: hypothetical protein CSA15_05180 [Candidatus Delongbacteria bacterium]